MSQTAPPAEGARAPVGTAGAADVVARNFLSLVTGEALARVIAFTATIYIARTLGPDSYGTIGFALAVVLYMSRLADGGMEFFGFGVREIAEDPARIDTLAPDLMTARLVMSGGLALLLLVAGFILPQPEGIVLALYGLTLLTVGGSTRWIHLGLERTRFAAAARIAGELTMVALVLLLVRAPEHVTRVPLAQFAGDALAALLLLGALRRGGARLPVRLNLAVAGPVFRRSMPLVASSLLGLMIYNSDLIFLRFFRDAAAVGYYAAAYTLISFLLNLGVAYSQTLLPTFTRLGATGTGRQGLYHTAMAQVFAVTLPIAVGGYLLAPQIIALVFGTGYQTSTPALALLIWTIPLALLREVGIVALVVTGRRANVLRLTAAAAGLNLVLNLALIPRFGIGGAAVATLITEIMRTTAALAYARGEGFRLAGATRLWRPAVASLAMAALLLLARPALLWVALALGGVAYTVTLALLGGIRFRGRAIPALTV